MYRVVWRLIKACVDQGPYGVAFRLDHARHLKMIGISDQYFRCAVVYKTFDLSLGESIVDGYKDSASVY